jgi:hypothetical protein
VDPATVSLAFATAKTAYAGVKGAIEIYKDVKATGGDLTEIVTEVGSCLSSFFHGQQQLEHAHEEIKQQRAEDAKAGKQKNVTQEAIENVIRVRQIRQYYKDLEHMVRWELGMPDLWGEIVEERDRLINERQEAVDEAAKQIEIANKKAAYRIRRMQELARLWAAGIAGCLVIALELCLLLIWVAQDRQSRWGY